jgi:hypothetical protein
MAYNGRGKTEHISKGRPMPLEGRMHVTNWRTGEAYFRGIADDSVARSNAITNTIHPDGRLTDAY